MGTFIPQYRATGGSGARHRRRRDDDRSGARITLNRPHAEIAILYDTAFLSSELAVNTSKRRLATHPTATPIDEQPIKAMVGLRPKLALTGDVTARPTNPPARQANKRVRTVFLL